MTNLIRIQAHYGGFWITHDTGSDRATILAEHRRYSDAMAAAHLLAREMGISVEAEPDARASMDHQTADALLTMRHHHPFGYRGRRGGRRFRADTRRRP
jgi:hypothetical protein